MPKFKKKDAIQVDAVQWNNNPADILALTLGFTKKRQKITPPGQAKKDDPPLLSEDFEDDTEVAFTRDAVIIRTPSGDLEVNPSDWLVKGNLGEFTAVKPDQFTLQYEATV
jgi:hypothetical protein